MIRRISMIFCLVLFLSLGLLGTEGMVNCNPISDDDYLKIKGDPWIISLDLCCDGKLDGGEISFKRAGTFMHGKFPGKWYMCRVKTELYITLVYDNKDLILTAKFLGTEGIHWWEGIMVRTSDGKIGCWRMRHP